MFPALSWRMPRPRAYSHLIVVSACTLLVAWFEFSGARWLQRIELAAQDALVRAGRAEPPDSSLVFLARDTTSANLEVVADLNQLFDLTDADEESRRALNLMAHEWPWSREIHALVLDRLISAGARAVVFDFTFPKPSPNDDAFRESLARHRDRVVVAGNITEGNGRDLGGEWPVFGVPTDSLIPQTPTRDPRIGFDNFWPDIDGVIRRGHYRWAVESGVWQSAEEFSLASRALQKAGVGKDVPVDWHGRHLRFAGPPGTFVPHSIHEIFVPKYWRNNYAGGAFFRDKIVVIGAAGNWQQDEHFTPMGVMPGPEIHLNAINAALHSAFLSDTPAVARILLVFVAAASASLLRRWVSRPYLRFSVQFLATAGWMAAALGLFNFADLLVPCLAPMLVFNLNGISGLFLDVMIERREKARLRGTLERYVSRNVVEEMIDQPDQFARALGGEMRDVTILFSDVRGFTNKAHEMNSRDLVTQLNEYFSAMVECVFRFGGTLDKFIGDAVMAVWGNAHSAGPAADARNAVACARAMLDELAKLNERWAAEGRPQYRIGIGLNAGEVVVGNIGSASRMEFTVIGDAVNMAWRLQEYSKQAGTDLVLGGPVVALLGSEFPTETLPPCRPSDGVVLECARLVAIDADALARTAGSREYVLPHR